MNNWLYFSTQCGYTHRSKCTCCVKELENSLLSPSPISYLSSQSALPKSLWIDILNSSTWCYVVSQNPGLSSVLWNCGKWLILPRVGWSAEERLERWHKQGHTGVGSGWVGREKQQLRRKKPNINTQTWDRLGGGSLGEFLLGSDWGQGWARPDSESWSTKVRTSTLSYGSPWRSLGSAGWYFIKNILVLTHHLRNITGLYINTTFKNY